MDVNSPGSNYLGLFCCEEIISLTLNILVFTSCKTAIPLLQREAAYNYIGNQNHFDENFSVHTSSVLPSLYWFT
jgi:hypothetical protein